MQNEFHPDLLHFINNTARDSSQESSVMSKHKMEQQHPKFVIHLWFVCSLQSTDIFLLEQVEQVAQVCCGVSLSEDTWKFFKHAARQLAAGGLDQISAILWFCD